jgi:glycosyltransferase involved in cell wall biosynthesis
MVAANKGFPSRKAFGENLMAFGEFAKTRPEALLYLHTVRGGQQGGVNFDALIPACGIPWDKVRFVDQYLNAIGLQSEYMASIYQATDVLMASSMGEGFGIPIVEAQACGCPVITTAWTSSPELTVNGICTAPAQPSWTLLDSWMCTPSVVNILDALNAIYAWEPSYRGMMAARGIANVYQHYDWDMLVRDHWAPFLARVEADIASERQGNAGHAEAGSPGATVTGQPG